MLHINTYMGCNDAVLKSSWQEKMSIPIINHDISIIFDRYLFKQIVYFAKILELLTFCV